MNTIELKYVTFLGDIEFYRIGKVWEVCQKVSMKFETGNVYCLDSYLSGGGWALSWLLSGTLQTSKNSNLGTIYWDGEEMSSEQLKELGWAVGPTGFEKTFSKKKHIGTLLEKLVKKSSRVDSVDELREKFMLPEESLLRNVYQVRNELWGASVAMGYAHGKRVFCFPWMMPEYLLNNKDLWVKRLIKPLVEEDCLVIIPTIYKEEISDIFTKVVLFEKKTGLVDYEPKEILEFPDSYK